MKHNGHEASVRLSHSICLSGGHFITQLCQYDVLWSLWVKFDPLPSVAERWAAQCFNLRPQTTEETALSIEMLIYRSSPQFAFQVDSVNFYKCMCGSAVAETTGRTKCLYY